MKIPKSIETQNFVLHDNNIFLIRNRLIIYKSIDRLFDQIYYYLDINIYYNRLITSLMF